MNLQIEAPSLHLQPREPLRLTARAGRRLTNISGTTWVTVDGDPRDFILEPGDTHAFPKDSAVLLQALGGKAQLVAEQGVEIAPSAQAPAGLWDALRHILRIASH